MSTLRELAKEGCRVFAIRDANDTTVRAYGFGTYDGDHVPPGTSTEPDDMIRDIVRRERDRLGIPTSDAQLDEAARGIAYDLAVNPRITLDNGGTVWGYQCWWGPAENLDDMAAWIKGRVIEYVEAP